MAAKNKIEVILSMLDRATAPLQSFNKKLAAMQEPVRKLNNSMTLLGKESGIGKLSERLGGVASAAGNVAGQLAYAGTAAVGAGFVFKRAFIDVAAEFERFETILGTIEGSSEKAKKSMDWIGDFAAKTPYELTEVTDAFVKLRAYGMEPTNGLLKSLGDTAAAMGKPIMQAVEAVADAVTGENERLKEFGIKARKDGDRFVYEYTENGKTMRAQARANNRAQIQATLEAIFNSKYAGAMDKLSGTWGGMMSNISDQWTRFAKMVMDSGPFEMLRTRLANFLARLDEMAKNGELQKIAEEWGQKISDAFVKIEEAGKKIYNFIEGFIDICGGLDNALLVLAAIAAGPLLLSLVALTGAVWGLGAALMATPIGWFIGLAALLAGAGVLVYKNWEPIKEWFASLFDGAVEGITKFMKKLGELVDYTPFGLAIKGIGMIGAAITGSGTPVPAGQAATPPAAGSLQAQTAPPPRDPNSALRYGMPGPPVGVNSMARTAVGGAPAAQTTTNNAKVEIDFKNVPRGVDVKPDRGNKVPMDLNMGYSGVW